jgi:hypothetical protein
MEYIILAHSRTKNQTQREINLMSPHSSDARDAQRIADSFAQRLNERKALGASDWLGTIELVGDQGFRTL